MTANVIEKDGGLLVALAGHVDLEHAGGVRQTLLDCLERGRDITVCLAAVDYIDSSGIATLVEALQLAREKGVGFALSAVSTQALRVLKLARLDRVFTILDGPAAATGTAG